MTAITRDPGDSPRFPPTPGELFVAIGLLLRKNICAGARMLLREIPVTQTCADALSDKGSSKMLFLRVPWLYALVTRLLSFFARPQVSRARMIEYYVPENFQTRQRLWLPGERRGKLIEFSGRGDRRSA
jgi:hypothetical protein